MLRAYSGCWWEAICHCLPRVRNLLISSWEICRTDIRYQQDGDPWLQRAQVSSFVSYCGDVIIGRKCKLSRLTKLYSNDGYLSVVKAMILFHDQLNGNGTDEDTRLAGKQEVCRLMSVQAELSATQVVYQKFSTWCLTNLTLPTTSFPAVNDEPLVYQDKLGWNQWTDNPWKAAWRRLESESQKEIDNCPPTCSVLRTSQIVVTINYSLH